MVQGRAAMTPRKVGDEVIVKLPLGEAIEVVPSGSRADGPPAPAPKIDFSTDPEVVRGVAEGERLGYGHLFNPTFATEISMIDPLPHQRIAVYDHMLTQPRLRFLVGHEPGSETFDSHLFLIGLRHPGSSGSAPPAEARIRTVLIDRSQGPSAGEPAFVIPGKGTAR
jgi:hypothetical protein